MIDTVPLPEELNPVVIGGTVGLVSSVGRAPDLQAGVRGFKSCIGHTFPPLFTLMVPNLNNPWGWC